PVLDLSKHRDTNQVNPRVVPVLSDRATAEPITSVPADFDFHEVDSPCALEDPNRQPIFGDRFLLFYEGSCCATDPHDYAIGVITSPEEDFIPLVTDRTIVMSPASMPPLLVNGTPIDPRGAADPTVIVDHDFMVNTAGRYQMWFEGTFGSAGTPSETWQSAILTCTSADGISWTAPTFCSGLEPGPAFGNVIRVADPSVVKTSEFTDPYRMAFEVERTDGSSAIGIAFSSDGSAWTIRDGVLSGTPAGPSFSGGPGNFDDLAIHSPSLALETDALGNVIEWMMFYEGRGFVDNDTVIGYATSLDGYSWSGFNLAVLTPSSDLVSPILFDSDDLKQPSMIQPSQYPGIDDNNTPTDLTDDVPYPRFLLYYAADGEEPVVLDRVNRIGLATGS
ncbi:MAG: hypothetical protein OSB09_02330, partial [Planctomycetota bacterium]|nr:hypothetical protein [Planctomycetota bacterium]